MDTNLSTKISISNRGKKYRLFMQLYNPTANDKILDIGYTNESMPSSYKNYLEKKYPYLNNITALGIQDYDSVQIYNKDIARGGGEFKVIKYDGKTFPFSDKSFDIGYCNAVIEHVGNRDAQILFVREICRVCKKVFLTTPNRFFPIETHTKYPFIHWLPDRSECSLKKILDAAGLKGKYCIYRQRFFGFTMTFSVDISTEVEVSRPVKILFCSSSGGHYWNILHLKKLADKYPSFAVTEKTDFCEDEICEKKYLFPMLNRRTFNSYLKIPFVVIKSIFILTKEKPTHIISSGAFAVFPLLLFGKILGKKIIFLETYARVNTPSFVGKLTYRFANLFIVQYRSMQKVYPKAKVGVIL